MSIPSSVGALASPSRRLVLNAGLAGVLAPPLASASPTVAFDLTGDWDLLANGQSGRLKLQHLANGFMAGSMYQADHTLSGFYCPTAQQIVLVRQVDGDIGQVFVGQVLRQGLVISGTFYALKQTWGATHAQNAFSFIATRPPLSAPTGMPPLSLGRPGRVCLPPRYWMKNRPAEFHANWLVELHFTQLLFSCVGSNLTGNLGGTDFFGHYAYLSGSLVFLRMLGSEPFQFYRGQVTEPAASLAGDFFALTTGAGASTQRIMYDWATL